MLRSVSVALLFSMVLPDCHAACAQSPPDPMITESPVRRSVILGSWMWDLESDHLGSSSASDLFWEQIDAEKRALNAMVGIALLGEHKLAEIGLPELVAAKYQQHPITGDKLRPGTVVALQTREGNLAKLRVLRYRALHDFDFPQAKQLTEEWRDFVRTKPNTKEYHLEVEWVLFEQPALPVEGEDLAQEIRTLQQKRVKVAKSHYENVLQTYQAGRANYELVFKAEQLLVQAKYDAASTPAARIGVLAEAVENAKSSYAFAKGRFEGGGGGASDMLQAEYGLLSAQLKLAEEKQRQAAPKDKR